MAESDLYTRLKLAFQAVGADINTLLAQDGTLGNLTTSAKTNLVSAVNEVKTKADKGVTDAAAASAAAATADGKATTADGKAVKAQSAVDALKTAVGDTTVDFAAIYAAAKA